MVYKALKQLVVKAFPKFAFKMKFEVDTDKGLFMDKTESR